MYKQDINHHKEHKEHEAAEPQPKAENSMNVPDGPDICYYPLYPPDLTKHP